MSSFADRGSSAEQLGSGGYETIAEESCRGSASGDGELTPAERMRRPAEAETGGRRGGHTRPAERRRRKLADADRRSVELQRHTPIRSYLTCLSLAEEKKWLRVFFLCFSP